MIRLEHISKTFHKGKPTQVVALKDVTLTVNGGEFLVILGGNGSGKSTLLNCISGSVQPEAGRIWIHNRDVTNKKEHDRAAWVARVFQNPLSGTAPGLTVLENFRLASLRRETKKLQLGITNRFRQMVREKIAGLGMGLEDKVDQLMGTLSGGQRQALTLLMAVMADPDILLLDEPTAALDPRTARQIMNLADDFIRNQQLTAVLITHNLHEALRYGNRLVHLDGGRVIKDLSATEKVLLRHEELLNWFEYL